MLIKIQEKFKKLMQMKPDDIKDKVAKEQEEIAKGVASGDPKIWHRVLMGIMILFVGIFLVGSVFFEFLLDMQAARFQNGIPVVQAKANQKLPKGEYHLYGIVHSGDSVEELQNLTFLVASSEGGVLVAVKAPAGTQLPEDFSIPTNYQIDVDEDGIWKLRMTPEARRNTPAAHVEQEEASASPATK